MRIGFIGLGTMGAGIAMNLRRSGQDLIVHDLNRASAEPLVAAGATWADSVTALGRDCDLAFTSVPDPKEFRAIGLGDGGLLDSMRPGTAWFDLTTNSPGVFKEGAQRLKADKNISLLDAPVSGGPAGARSGKLAIYVGGDKAIFDQHQGLLRTLADQVLHVGGVGAGCATKLVHNVASLTIRMAIAEVMSLGVKAGVDPLELWHAVRQGAIGRARTFDRIGDQYLQDSYEPPNFTVNLALKDLELGLNFAKEIGVPMHYAEVSRQDFMAAVEKGWGKMDSRAPMRLQNQRAGVTIRVSAEDVRGTLARS